MTLNEVCKFIVDAEHKTAPITKEGFASIRTPNIGKGRLLLEGVNRVSEEIYKEWTKRAVPQTDDLILAREAPVGNVAIIPDNSLVCLGQRTVLLRPNPKIVDPKFLCYYLLGDQIQNDMKSRSGGATVAHLNMKDIRSLNLGDIPKMEIQQKIASILYTYDDLIENNLQRIKLLEEAAQNIYKEWFVYFHFPGYENAEFENGSPKGWKKIKMLECYSHATGGGWGSDTLVNEFTEEAYVIRGTDFNAINVGKFSLPLRYHKTSNIKSRKLMPGDIILEVSNGNLNKVGSVLLTSGKLLSLLKKDVICASFCKLLRPRSKRLQDYLFSYINEMNLSGRMSQYKSPSAAGINNFHFENFLQRENVIIPPDELLDKLDAVGRPISTQRNNLIAQISLLKEARDILLPRLMNRTIEV